MVTIAVQDKYAEILTAFGNLQESVDTALQRYTIEQITSKVNELRQNIKNDMAQITLPFLNVLPKTKNMLSTSKQM